MFGIEKAEGIINISSVEVNRRALIVVEPNIFSNVKCFHCNLILCFWVIHSVSFN